MNPDAVCPSRLRDPVGGGQFGGSRRCPAHPGFERGDLERGGRHFFGIEQFREAIGNGAGCRLVGHEMREKGGGGQGHAGLVADAAWGCKSTPVIPGDGEAGGRESSFFEVIPRQGGR